MWSSFLGTDTVGLKVQLREGRVGLQGTGHHRRTLCTDITTLTQLNLEDNRIGAEGVAQVGRALEANTTLTQLNLWEEEEKASSFEPELLQLVLQPRR